MASLKELIAQKEALELEIERTKQESRSDAIARVRALMDEHGLSVGDLSVKRGPKPSGASKGGKVPAKFRDPSTGDAWSGRGLQPKWLKAALEKGRKLADFAV